jgi:hypothetical protein
MCHTDGPSVRDNGLWYAMITDDVQHVQLYILPNSVCGDTGIKWDDLVKRSTMTQLELCPRKMRGKLTMKSIQMFSHFHSGMLKGCRFPVGLK